MLASNDDSLELDQNLPNRISISELIAHKEQLDKLLSNGCFLDFFLEGGTAKECMQDQLTSNQERVSSLLGGG